MHKACKPYPSEYQDNYTKKKLILATRRSYKPLLYWEDQGKKKLADLDENAEKLVRELILDRYKSDYQVNYLPREPDESDKSDESTGVGDELISYLKQLYLSKPKEKLPRVPFTSTRVFSYASKETLHRVLSTYQDTYGRAGGWVILKNVQKMVAAAKRRNILEKIRRKMEAEEAEEAKYSK